LCYRKLWEIKVENGIHYLFDLIDSYIKNNNSFALIESVAFYYKKNQIPVEQIAYEEFNRFSYYKKFDAKHLTIFSKIIKIFEFEMVDQSPFENLESLNIPKSSIIKSITNSKVIFLLKKYAIANSVETGVAL
jgi:hypothetical protein